MNRFLNSDIFEGKQTLMMNDDVLDHHEKYKMSVCFHVFQVLAKCFGQTCILLQIVDQAALQHRFQLSSFFSNGTDAPCCGGWLFSG